MMRSVSRVARLRVVRYLAVGVLNTAFSYAVYALLLWLGLPFAMANLLALVAGIVLGFKTQGTIVFGVPGNRLFLRFVLCWSVVYVFNIASIKVFLIFGFDAYVAGLVALPVMTATSYVLLKHFVFHGMPTSSSRALEARVANVTSPPGVK